MSQFIKKMFNLKDMKYPWILVVSMGLFAFSFYIDRINSRDPIWLLITFFGSFMIAVLWGSINYIGHIRMNKMYQKQNDIHVYVNQLVMNEEDKLELQTYLEDYVQDLMRQGNTKEEASREAINQFKVKEFLSLSKNTSFFNLHAHYYLIGWTISFTLTFMMVWLIDVTIETNFLMFLIIEVTFAAYAAGMFGMFFLYKLIDAVIYRKFRELF